MFDVIPLTITGSLPGHYRVTDGSFDVSTIAKMWYFKNYRVTVENYRVTRFAGSSIVLLNV